MIFETKKVLGAAARWMDSGRRCSGLSPAAAVDELLQISYEVQDLVGREAPDPLCSHRSGLLFDRVASKSFGPDQFGERYEIAAILAYIGWRHAYAAGNETEAEDWCKVTDSLVWEESIEFQRLDAFLSLPSSEKTSTLAQSLLASAFDLFLSLAILRRDRLRRPLSVINAASWIHRWLSSEAVTIDHSEQTYFCAVSSWIVASGCRLLGRGRQAKLWLAIAKRDRRALTGGEASRVRLQLLTLLDDRERHRYRHLQSRLISLKERCLRIGLYRESLMCRFASAMVARVLGTDDLGLREFEDLYRESRDTIHSSLAGTSLAIVNGIRAEQGVPLKDADLWEAVEIVKASGDLAIVPSAIAHIAGTYSSLGKPAEAARLFEIAASQLELFGAEYWYAYTRLLLADALVAIGRFREALTALLVAIPILEEEDRGVEAVHALNLLETAMLGLRGDPNRISEIAGDC